MNQVYIYVVIDNKCNIIFSRLVFNTDLLARLRYSYVKLIQLFY